MESGVAAALVSGGVSLVVAAGTLLVARWQFRNQRDELEIKRQEVEKIGTKIKAESDALRQTIMKDVLAKRMDAYAALWKLLMTYERNWLIEGRPIDAAWATEYLLKLNACNADHGVFFSQSVYAPFYQYRERLVGIVEKAKAGQALADTDIHHLMQVSTTGTDGMKSLATAMKDDLGSYIRVITEAA